MPLSHRRKSKTCAIDRSQCGCYWDVGLSDGVMAAEKSGEYIEKLVGSQPPMTCWSCMVCFRWLLAWEEISPDGHHRHHPTHRSLDRVMCRQPRTPQPSTHAMSGFHQRSTAESIWSDLIWSLPMQAIKENIPRNKSIDWLIDMYPISGCVIASQLKSFLFPNPKPIHNSPEGWVCRAVLAYKSREQNRFRSYYSSDDTMDVPMNLEEERQDD